MKTISTDLSNIFEALDNAQQYEGYIVARCPFHDDARPSFFVYPDWFRCLSCNAQGKTSSLLQRMGKEFHLPDPRPHQTNSTNPFSIWLKGNTLKRTLKAAWTVINDNPGMGYYMTRDRGIEEPYRKYLGIGYMDDWYTIPIRNRDGIIISAVARKGRDNTSTHKYVLPNGTNPNILYVPNWQQVRHARYLILTFGILDAITLAIMGEPSASTITGKKVSKTALVQFRIPILLIPDRKEEQDGLNLTSQLGWRGSNIRMQWPDGCDDINDIWMKDRELCKHIIKGIANGIN